MNPIIKRLLPLFVANFFAGLMFHYSIAFPFFSSIGFDTNQLASYAILTAVMVLLLEVPSGILADRWSRKGTSMIALLFMIIGVLIIGSADNFKVVMIGTVFAGIYFGMRSGMVEAMIYDLLLEHDQRKDYEKYVGMTRSINTVGLVISSIVGAVIASTINFSTPYYMSAVCAFLALLFLFKFKEPQLHRQVETARLPEHIKDLFVALSRHAEVRLLVFTAIVVGILSSFMMEVDPLWPLALGLATIWYGPLNAFLLSSQGIAGPLVSKIVNRNHIIQLVAFGMFLATIGLLVSNIWVIALSQFTLLACATSLTIILSGRIQDELPSSQRSGAESAISTFATLSFLIILPIFSSIAQRSSIFTAAWLLVIIAIIGFFGINRCFKTPSTK